jgi:hypothetical protein
MANIQGSSGQTRKGDAVSVNRYTGALSLCAVNKQAGKRVRGPCSAAAAERAGARHHHPGPGAGREVIENKHSTDIKSVNRVCASV